jgi:hypothetical protein
MRNPLAFALALFAVACVPTCGTESLPLAETTDAGAGTATGGGTDPGTQPTPDAGTQPPPGPGTQPPPGPQPPPSPGTQPAPGAGAAGAGAIGPRCVADGQPCAKATDACSLACNGTAGQGGLCKQDGQDCLTGTNAECCSDSCIGNRCVAVTTGCHPAGERCSGGPFAVDGCCGAATCVNPGQATAHCALPTVAQDPVNGVCFGAGVPCSAAQDCCSNACVGGSCQ